MNKPQVPPIVTRIAKWAAALAPASAPRNSLSSIQRHLLAGGLIVFCSPAALVVAATTQLSGALIAQGSIVVDLNVKKVQHPTGGIVGKLLVRDGDHVKANDILVQLDETVMRANLAIVTKGLDELTARKARLEAERDGAATISFPPDLVAHANEPDIREAVESERKLFALRRAARLGQKSQLQQRIEQLGQETDGIMAQQSAKAQEIELINRELSGVRDLYSKNCADYTPDPA